MTNGVINLMLSPDKSRVIMIGEPNGGTPFAFPIVLGSTSIKSVDPEEFSDNTSVWKATPPPHVLTSILVYGWSPDSRSYLAARFYADSLNVADYTMQGEFVVINADSGDIVFTYNLQKDIHPFLTWAHFGFDLVWPE
jgi:hypothetical protein